ncbi:hypothetical protein NDU88_003311 [Pleurodeles waltl]|uniref:Uncharacterized protein n=1 Tax=Pleurodeles waltl TaxID=8319 RepID=A0AAV7KUI7_PLEWA|nr:hypothetical protein NDU88_003311 [Pleurodeles waltl]
MESVFWNTWPPSTPRIRLRPPPPWWLQAGGRTHGERHLKYPAPPSLAGFSFILLPLGFTGPRFMACNRNKVGKRKGRDPERSQLLKLVLAKLGNGDSDSGNSASDGENNCTESDRSRRSHVPPSAAFSPVKRRIKLASQCEWNEPKTTSPGVAPQNVSAKERRWWAQALAAVVPPRRGLSEGSLQQAAPGRALSGLTSSSAVSVSGSWACWLLPEQLQRGAL